jgi:pyruvate kinase
MKIEKLDIGLSEMLQYMIDHEQHINVEVSNVHKDYKLGAKNLYRYLILRSFDLRKYHETLSEIGVSSLRTAEGYVFSNLYRVVNNLRLIQNKPFIPKTDIEIVGFKKSKKLLKKHANSLFHETEKKHFTEIMVTLPNEAAEDKTIIRDMAISGMQIARINLSHGNKDIWQNMVNIIHEVREETQLKLKIYMDLSGPKIRTSTIKVKDSHGKTKSWIPIRQGEHIILTKLDTFGKASRFNKDKEQLKKAIVGVSLPEIIDQAQIGDVVLFDDGMIKSTIITKNAEELELEINECYKPKLASHKGINLPNTILQLPALTEEDLKNLPFVCKYADIMGYSFVRTGDDVKALYTALEENNNENLGIVFKIENKEAFENLPDILLEGMRRNKIGVMIARGDLAVELGFQRISEVQNEILWLCEAAHVPVIWATQVLENLAKSGIPTRAEISDAAQSVQAECVMLNKGPHINEAIRILKNILKRMGGHSYKKKNELRALKVSDKYFQRLKEINLSQSI